VERLDDEALARAAARLMRWQVTAQALRREARFEGAFPQVMDFVDRAAALAQAAGHHPDLGVHYDRVEITLTSHDLGGVTDRDVALAEALERALERVGEAASPNAPAYDAKTKETALRALTYGLVVIGSRAADELNGMTANWVTQVSFDPPLVAVAVENDAHTCDLIHRGGVFSVNVVPSGRQDLVERFVKPQRRVADKLGDVPFREGKTGAPILTEAVAAFDCRVTAAHLTGDHTLFVGSVVGAYLPAPGEAMTLRELGWHYGG
jgi:flavin reductase (DIM6/NTAB) family NADH-FMN oxidoreductase RutF/pterin-4a-carbinolamine dehydratase